MTDCDDLAGLGDVDLVDRDGHSQIIDDKSHKVALQELRNVVSASAW